MTGAPRPTLLDLLTDARPRIARMGHDAIAQAHAAGVPAWVSDGEGRIVRLDPDGTEHVMTEYLQVDPAQVAAALAVLDLVPDVPPDPGDELPPLPEPPSP